MFASMHLFFKFMFFFYNCIIRLFFPAKKKLLAKTVDHWLLTTLSLWSLCANSELVKCHEEDKQSCKRCLQETETRLKSLWEDLQANSGMFSVDLWSAVVGNDKGWRNDLKSVNSSFLLMRERTGDRLIKWHQSVQEAVAEWITCSRIVRVCVCLFP